MKKNKGRKTCLAKMVKGEHGFGDVETVNSIEVKHSVEVEQFEYSRLKKLKITIPVSLW